MSEIHYDSTAIPRTSALFIRDCALTNSAQATYKPIASAIAQTSAYMHLAHRVLQVHKQLIWTLAGARTLDSKNVRCAD